MGYCSSSFSLHVISLSVKVNGLFFYAHVVHRNSISFFPISTQNFNIFRLFIAWLNLDLGIEVCFYKSMTQYDKAWIQCGFLFYLCILELAIIILSRKYIFFTRLFGRNVIKVLATLFLICCAKMIDIGIGTRYGICSDQALRWF